MPLTTSDIQLIQRIRRNTTNPDILALCDLAWRLDKAGLTPPAVKPPEVNAGKPKFNRGDYMRGYMQRRRAALRRVGSIS